MTSARVAIGSAILILLLFTRFSAFDARAIGVPESPAVLIDEENGLKWGVTPNTILDYQLEASSAWGNVTYDLSDSIYLKIGTLMPLVENLTYLPTASFAAYWSGNGSRLYLGDYFHFWGRIHAVYSAALPVGNWSFIEYLITGEVLDLIFINATFSFTNDTTLWGFDYSYVYYGSLINCETRWYRSDGTLYSVNMSAYVDDTHWYRATLGRIYLMDPTLPWLGAGVIFIVLVVYLYKTRDKSDK